MVLWEGKAARVEQHRQHLRLDAPTTDSQLSVCNQRVPTAAAAVRVDKKLFVPPAHRPDPPIDLATQTTPTDPSNDPVRCRDL